MSRRDKILRILFSMLMGTVCYICFTKLLQWCPYNIGYQLPEKIKSMNCDVFLYKKRNFQLKNGDLVFFKVKGYGKLSDLTDGFTLFKRIGGLPGQYIFCDKYGCFVNGEKTGTDIPPSLTPNFQQTIGIIPPGFFAPFGDNERSYDTRFAGLVPIKTIKGKVIWCIVNSRKG